MFDRTFTSWLLDAETPTIRYLTLCHLLDRPSTDPDLLAARSTIMETGPVPAILAKQTEEGHWHTRRSYYSPKYTSTHWSMMLLAEFHADGSHPGIQRGVDTMLESTLAKSRDALGGGQLDLACFWGNLLRYTAQFGRTDDPRVPTVVDNLVYGLTRSDSKCYANDHLPCSWGAVRALWGLAALPADLRSPAVEEAVEAGLAMLFEDYDPVAADYPTPGRRSDHWGRLSYPLFYQADVLFVLRIAAELDALDHPGAQPALAWLADRSLKNGRWRGASPYRRRTHDDIVEREETDRWVSLYAAMILKQAQFEPADSLPVGP
jgi:hypothetical protein